MAVITQTTPTRTNTKIKDDSGYGRLRKAVLSRAVAAAYVAYVV